VSRGKHRMGLHGKFAAARLTAEAARFVGAHQAPPKKEVPIARAAHDIDAFIAAAKTRKGATIRIGGKPLRASAPKREPTP
jgi:hypothetical protein